MADEKSTDERLTALENRLLGLEIAVNEVIYYAHDAGRRGEAFNKDALVARFVHTLRRMQTLYPDENIREQVSLPMARMGVAIRDAKPLNEQRDAIDEEPGDAG